MLWCVVLITKLWIHSTTPPAASMNSGTSQERFSSNSSALSAGKNSLVLKNGPSCSTTGWMMMSFSVIGADIGSPRFGVASLRSDDELQHEHAGAKKGADEHRPLQPYAP